MAGPTIGLRWQLVTIEHTTYSFTVVLSGNQPSPKPTMVNDIHRTSHEESAPASNMSAAMLELFQKRMEGRPKEELEQMGLPPNHAPAPRTYQDLLPPPTNESKVENVDRVALELSAENGNTLAQESLQQLHRQTQQHVLTAQERSFLAQAMAAAGASNNNGENGTSSD